MSQKSTLRLSELKDVELECEIDTKPIYGFKPSFHRAVPEEIMAQGIKRVRINFKGTWLDVTDLIEEHTWQAIEDELNES